MSGARITTVLMSGAKSRKWVHQNPTNQPTNQLIIYNFNFELLYFKRGNKKKVIKIVCILVKDYISYTCTFHITCTSKMTIICLNCRFSF